MYIIIFREKNSKKKKKKDYFYLMFNTLVICYNIKYIVLFSYLLRLLIVGFLVSLKYNFVFWNKGF